MKKIVVVCAGFALAVAAGMSHATKPGNNGGGIGPRRLTSAPE